MLYRLSVICTATFFICVNCPAIAAELNVVLLDSNNRRVEHGDAMINAFSGDDTWTMNVGYLREKMYYTGTLPDTDVLNLEIWTKGRTRRGVIAGLYGRQSQTIYLRVDSLQSDFRTRSTVSSPIYSELSELVDDLDKMYPNGVPPHMTNIRTYIRNVVLPELEFTDPSYAEDGETDLAQIRSRLARHLQ